MNAKALLVCSAALFLSACASGPKISGQSPSTFGSSAEKVWASQLEKSPRGIENQAITRGVRGTEAAFSENGSSVPVKVGSILRENSQIQTGADTGVDLFIGDNGPVLRLKENTTLKIVRLRVDAKSKSEKIVDTMLDLEKGTLMGNVKKLAAESSYLIRTRNAVLKIRGTEFNVSAEGNVSIVKGAAQVFADGKTYAIGSGQSFVPQGKVR